jgi:signal peptidase I
VDALPEDEVAEEVQPRADEVRLGFVSRAILAITGPWTWSNAISWFLLLGLVLAFRWTVAEPYKIPSGSMEPTLHGDERLFKGDRVFVNKWIYGMRVPFTRQRLFKLNDPKRWDVVVFKSPEKDPEHETLIKRVVGLPGERINIRDGHIVVNGQPVEPPEELRKVLNYTTELARSENDVRYLLLQLAKQGRLPSLLNPGHKDVQEFIKEISALGETLKDQDLTGLSETEIRYLSRDLTPAAIYIGDNMMRIRQDQQYPLRYGVSEEEQYAVVPQGCYLLCGDNSGNSVDGRVFGWVPNGNLMGRAFCIWWPLDRLRDLSGFSHTAWFRVVLLLAMVAAAGYCVVRLRRRKRLA